MDISHDVTPYSLNKFTSECTKSTKGNCQISCFYWGLEHYLFLFMRCVYQQWLLWISVLNDLENYCPVILWYLDRLLFISFMMENISKLLQHIYRPFHSCRILIWSHYGKQKKYVYIKLYYGKYEFKIKYYENETLCCRRLSDRFSGPVPSLPYSLLVCLFNHGAQFTPFAVVLQPLLIEQKCWVYEHSNVPLEKVHSLIAKFWPEYLHKLAGKCNTEESVIWIRTSDQCHYLNNCTPTPPPPPQHEHCLVFIANVKIIAHTFSVILI